LSGNVSQLEMFASAADPNLTIITLPWLSRNQSIRSYLGSQRYSGEAPSNLALMIGSTGVETDADRSEVEKIKYSRPPISDEQHLVMRTVTNQIASDK